MIKWLKPYGLRASLGWVLLAASCGRAPAPVTPAPAVSEPSVAATEDIPLADDEFSVMTFNLHYYALADRGGPQPEQKPAREREAVVDIIARIKPDILAVQEMGNRAIFEEFRAALHAAGLNYPHQEFLQRGQSELNMAVLSRYPMTDRQPRLDDRYSIGEAEIAVLRGFVDVEIEVAPEYRFRLMTAHLKSKVFHQLGQTEMRRNEARLLNKHVRNFLKDTPDINLLVVGDFNDNPGSAALREVAGADQQYLQDVRPVDFVGDAWTYFDPGADQYSRLDYMLVSYGMAPEVVREKTRVIRDRLNMVGSDHRPVVTVFKKQNLTAASGEDGEAPAAGLPVEADSSDELPAALGPEP